MVEASEIFIEATVALRNQEEGPAAAAFAFEQAAQAALAQRTALVA